MCGRFAQPRSPDELARIFRATAVSDLPGDRFNVAPTDPVAAVVERHGERVVDTFRWGLVPFFAEGPKSRSPLINARAETVETALVGTLNPGDTVLVHAGTALQVVGAAA